MYQKRYEEHQAKKKKQLTQSVGTATPPKATTMMEVLHNRRSQRVFNGKSVSDAHMLKVLAAATIAPSSCNRHGLKLKIVSERRDKELLNGILVGGVGWLHRADKVILFFADPVAYASPNEKDFMHYCDVGFTAMAMWLAAEDSGLGAAYINPNCYWHECLWNFADPSYIFCGALVLGHYDEDKRATKAEEGNLDDMVI